MRKLAKLITAPTQPIFKKLNIGPPEKDIYVFIVIIFINIFSKIITIIFSPSIALYDSFLVWPDFFGDYLPGGGNSAEDNHGLTLRAKDRSEPNAEVHGYINDQFPVTRPFCQQLFEYASPF